MEQLSRVPQLLSLCSRAWELQLRKPVLHKGSHCKGKRTHTASGEKPSLAATRGKSHSAMKTQHGQKINKWIKLFFKKELSLFIEKKNNGSLRCANNRPASWSMHWGLWCFCLTPWSLGWGSNFLVWFFIYLCFGYYFLHIPFIWSFSPFSLNKRGNIKNKMEKKEVLILSVNCFPSGFSAWQVPTTHF